MAITITKPTNIPFLEGFLGSSGGDEFRIRTIQLDSSYPSGGYGSAQGFTSGSLGFPTIGMKTVGGMMVLGASGPAAANFTPALDRTNSKLLILRNEGGVPPQIIVEEVVTITANAGQLSQVPAYIMVAHQSAGGTTGAAKIVPTGSTLGTKQVDVNWLTGAVKTFSTDAVTTLLVTYIPLGVGAFIPANRVVDEVVVLGNGATVNLANRAALVQYVYDTQGASVAADAMTFVSNVNAPTTGQIYVNLTNGANTSLLDNAAQNTHIAKVTYWKASAFGAQYSATSDASVTATSNVIAYGTVIPAGFPLLPAYGTNHAALATNAEVTEIALGPSGSAVAGQAVYDPLRNKITFAAGDAITRDWMGYVLLPEVTFSNEASPGQNLSTLTFTALFIGS